MPSARAILVGALLAIPGFVRAGPEEYLTPLPPPWTVQLDLPPRTPPGPPGEAALSTERSARELRDEALAAYEQQDYTGALAALDRMSATAPLTPTLRLLQAWCASFSGLDARGADLWSQMANLATNDAQAAFMAGWHCMQQQRYRDAYAFFLRSRSLRPGRDASHAAALGAWGTRRLAAAERLLVEAMRQPPVLPESHAAMGALQAEQGADAIAIGWLRKALSPLDRGQRSELLFRPSFNRLWQRNDPSWTNLLAEFDLPNDRALLAEWALATEPAPAERPPPPQTRPGLSVLNVSPFSRDPAQRALQLDILQRNYRLQRLELEDPLPAAPADSVE